jgi:threonine synthase
MDYQSTRDSTQSTHFIEAVLQERASDCGLLLPDITNLSPIAWMPDFVEFAAQLLSPFTEPDLGKAETLSLVRRAFSFPVRWRELSKRRYQLELFHGPTGSLKDFGAQFLAQLIATVPTTKQRLVMVAVTGESGPAIGAAFSQQPDVQVVMLFPKNGVSAQQAHLLGSWGSNIQALAVDGSLEECQQMVPTCLQDPDIQDQFAITHASEVNIAWLLPQIAYYAYSSLLSERLHRQPMNVIIPTGNGGHLTAACLAKMIGYPIDTIVAAQNRNRPVVDYVATGFCLKKPVIKTLANEMDVSMPANFARLQALLPDWEDFIEHIQACSVTDYEIKDAIESCHKETNTILCPHAATAYASLPAVTSDPRAWTIAAIAHPIKYTKIIEPIIKQKIEPSASIAKQLKKPSVVSELPIDGHTLRQIVLDLQTEEIAVAC